MNDSPKVSVCVLAFNHEPYIGGCLTSILSQEVSFSFEVIVGVDKSDDQTREIVEDYVARFPGRVRAIYHAENVGGQENYFAVHRVASGDFVCHIDGDDMTLDGKLEAQYQVLSSDPDLVMCTHNMFAIGSQNRISKTLWNPRKEGRYNLKFYLFNMPFFCHSSKMYRKSKALHLNRKFGERYDFELSFSDLCAGDVYHIERPLGAYRIGAGTSTNHGESVVNESMAYAAIALYDRARDYFPERVCNSARANKTIQLARQAARREGWIQMKLFLSLVRGKHALSAYYFYLRLVSTLPVALKRRLMVPKTKLPI